MGECSDFLNTTSRDAIMMIIAMTMMMKMTMMDDNFDDDKF